MAQHLEVGSLISVLIVILVLYVIYTTLQQSQYSIPTLSIDSKEARFRRFGLIIDVRSPKEREQLGFYPNSIPIPVESLEKDVPLLHPNKKSHILVYSNGDHKAVAAAEILYRMGYHNTRYITKSYLSLMPGSHE